MRRLVDNDDMLHDFIEALSSPKQQERDDLYHHEVAREFVAGISDKGHEVLHELAQKIQYELIHGADISEMSSSDTKEYLQSLIKQCQN